jgi:hypothetical protein
VAASSNTASDDGATGEARDGEDFELELDDLMLSEAD